MVLGKYLLRIDGIHRAPSPNSMKDAGVRDEDYAILRRQNTANRGDIVAVVISEVDSEATLKGYSPENDRVRFVPANDAYEEIVIKHGSGQRWDILGKLVGAVRFMDGMMPEGFA